jgi:hypothetical protein
MTTETPKPWTEQDIKFWCEQIESYRTRNAWYDGLADFVKELLRRENRHRYIEKVLCMLRVDPDGEFAKELRPRIESCLRVGDCRYAYRKILQDLELKND